MKKLLIVAAIVLGSLNAFADNYVYNCQWKPEDTSPIYNYQLVIQADAWQRSLVMFEMDSNWRVVHREYEMFIDAGGLQNGPQSLAGRDFSAKRYYGIIQHERTAFFILHRALYVSPGIMRGESAGLLLHHYYEQGENHPHVNVEQVMSCKRSK